MWRFFCNSCNSLAIARVYEANFVTLDVTLCNSCNSSAFMRVYEANFQKVIKTYILHAKSNKNDSFFVKNFYFINIDEY